MKNRPFADRLGFSLGGVAHALRVEHSFRTQAVAAGGVLVLMLWLRPDPIWWAAVCLTSGAVLAAELFNTALEHLADHLHPEQHPSIKIVKDLGAAAVLIQSIAAIGVAAALSFALFDR
jgi:undecaprenol kinase